MTQDRRKPEGWYPDPDGQPVYRRWSGHSWTRDTASGSSLRKRRRVGSGVLVIAAAWLLVDFWISDPFLRMLTLVYVLPLVVILVVVATVVWIRANRFRDLG